MSKQKILALQFSVAALLAVAVIACGGGSGDSHEAVEEAAAVEPVSKAVVAAKLAGADLVDGEQDHVVSRCPGCSLAMDGSADHALTVEDYELHFCSDSCRDNFTADDILARVAKLEIPES